MDTQKSIVLLFLDRFTLNEDEVEAITSRERSLGSQFFSAMNKTEQIRNDCRVLMSGEDGPTKAGYAPSCYVVFCGVQPPPCYSMDIMATTSSYLEQGYDKVYRWLTFEFRRIGRESQLEVSSVMGESIRRLSQRPELLSCVSSFFLAARTDQIIQRCPRVSLRSKAEYTPRTLSRRSNPWWAIRIATTH